MKNRIRKTIALLLSVCFIINSVPNIGTKAEGANQGKFLSEIVVNSALNVNKIDNNSGIYDATSQVFYQNIIDNYDSISILEIETAGELVAFSKAVNEGRKTFEDKTVILKNDINLQGVKPDYNYTDDTDDELGNKREKLTISGTAMNAWIPIGSMTNPFRGTFNGNNKKITHMVAIDKKASGATYSGLFGYSDGSISNIGIGNADGEDSCTIAATSSSISSSNAGGIVGRNEGSISNSYSTGGVVASSPSSSNAGGITGYNTSNISNSYNTGDVQAFSSSTPSVGGIAGYSTSIIINTYNTGGLQSSSTASYSYTGGIVGRSESIINNSYNTGNVQSSSTTYSYAGGIAGRSFTNCSISNSYNTGGVASTFTLSSSSSSSNAGGIAGRSDGILSNSYNTGSVQADSDSGGIAGNSIGSISNSYNTGNVQADSDAGGIAGTGGSLVTDSYYECTVTAKDTENLAGILQSGLADAMLASNYESYDGNDIFLDNSEQGISRNVWYYSDANHPELKLMFKKIDMSVSQSINTLNAEYEVKTFIDLVNIENITYKWYKDGVEIPNESTNEYTITAVDNNKLITVVISSSNYSGSVSYSIIGKCLIPSDLSVTIDDNITYGDDLNPTITSSGTGEQKIEYKVKDTDDATYTESKPVVVGEYTVRVTQEADATYPVGKAMADFTIVKKELTINVSVKDKKYDGKTDAQYENAPELLGVVTNDDVSIEAESGKPSFEDSIVGSNKAVSFTEFKIEGDDNTNYTLTQPSGITASIVDGFMAIQDTHYSISSESGIDDWYTSEKIKIEAISGYEISKTNTVDGTWVSSFEIIQDTPNETEEFYIRNTTTGEISQKAEFNYKKDSVAPKGKITVSENTWEAFLNNVTFGLFFNESKEIEITSTETGVSGSSIAYQLCETVYTDVESTLAGTWTTYTGTITINPVKKCYVYAKITNGAGKVTVINSDGIVLYTDSEQDTESIEFIKTGSEDITASVKLNGNTIAKVLNGVTELTKGTDYTVSGSDITFKATYLDTLVADNYTINVHYNPAGVEYKNQTSAGDVPLATTITLQVNKTEQQSLELSGLQDSYIYGDEDVVLNTTGGSTTGSVSYRVSAGDSGVISIANGTMTILKPGIVTITAVKNGDNNYQDISISKEITVGKKELTINVSVKDKNYDGKTDAQYENAPELLGVVTNDDVSIVAESGKPSFEDSLIGENKAVSFTEFKLEGNDSSNYTLTQPPGITASIVDGFTAVKDIHYSISGELGENDWYISGKIKIEAKDGYEMSKTNTVDGTWVSSFEITENTPNETEEFYIRNTTTGEISSKTEFNYKKDSVIPKGKITVSENAWEAFLNNVTFGLFFKESKEIEIISTEAGLSGSSIAYQLSETVYTDVESALKGTWTTYTNTITINPVKKCYVYAKITNGAGKITVINSDGIVLYTDSVQDTESIEFIKTESEDITASVTLNGNTIAKVLNGVTELTKGTDYTVSGSDITFKATYLDTLVADNYTINVYYNPAGVEYKNQTSTGDVPLATTITLQVKKAEQQSFEITGLQDIYTYGDGDVAFNITGGSGTGAVSCTVSYADGGSGAISITNGIMTILKPGKATITVVKNGDDNYQDISVSKKITVNPKELTIEDISIKDKKYDGKTDAQYENDPKLIGVITRNGVSDDVSIADESGKPSFEDSLVGENKAVNFTEFKIVGSDSFNYKLIQPFGVTASIEGGFTVDQDTHYSISSEAESNQVNGWFTSGKIGIEAASGYKISKTNTADSIWSSFLEITQDSSDGTQEYYMRNSSTGEISRKAEFKYKKDSTAPQKPLVSGSSDQWMKESVVLTVIGSDSKPADGTGGSGISYFEYSIDAGNTFTKQDWKEDNTFTITEDGDYTDMIVVRITDHAGNTSELSLAYTVKINSDSDTEKDTDKDTNNNTNKDTEKDTNKDTEKDMNQVTDKETPVTGDRTNVIFYVFILSVAGIVTPGILGYRYKKKN